VSVNRESADDRVRAQQRGSLRKRYVDTRFGQMHLVEAGAGAPVVFLHQSPRSWAEYAHLLPYAAEQLHVIALDSPGFGASAPVPGELSIEHLADGVQAVLDALGLGPVTLVGHHTGAVVAVEVAARDAEVGSPSVAGLVLSAMPFVTPERRARVRNSPPIDAVQPAFDGSHLSALWQRRRSHYPPGSERSLEQFVIDALRAHDDVERGHIAVNEYDMPGRLLQVRAPALLLCGSEDSYSLPDQAELARILDAPVHVIDGAGVAMPELFPRQFAAAVVRFVTGR
jgi:pimeloyl-ACP methyl ester carboxylesterase